MQEDSIDILVDQLYSSNDPLCFEAAYELSQSRRDIEFAEKKLADIALAAKYMMESLIEITHLSSERDRKSKFDEKTVKEELQLRLSECGEIARDTINLRSVKKAYERMYNE